MSKSRIIHELNTMPILKAMYIVGHYDLDVVYGKTAIEDIRNLTDELAVVVGRVIDRL